MQTFLEQGVVLLVLSLKEAIMIYHELLYLSPPVWAPWFSSCLWSLCLDFWDRFPHWDAGGGPPNRVSHHPVGFTDSVGQRGRYYTRGVMCEKFMVQYKSWFWVHGSMQFRYKWENWMFIIKTVNTIRHSCKQKGICLSMCQNLRDTYLQIVKLNM